MVDCGLVNLGACLTQKIFDYILGLLNSPIQPILNLNLHLLSEPISISSFLGLWAIMVYMLSMFYAFLIMYSGFNFIISGHDVVKRENSKTWLRNVVIMIILVQSSYFIYQLVISLAASITNATITLIDPNFFLLGTGGFTDVGLSILFSLLYLGTLVISAFMLILRYAFVSIGVVLLPLAIFFYFIPALRQYGSLILNFLGTSIFIVILDAVLLTGFSKIVDISIFGELKIFVLITAFGLINWLMFFLMFFSIIKSCINVGTKIAGTVASVAKYFV